VLLLRRARHFRPDRRLRRNAPRLVGAALAMGAALWLADAWAAPGAGWLGAAWLAAICTLGGVVYFGLAHLLGGLDLRELRRMVRRRR